MENTMVKENSKRMTTFIKGYFRMGILYNEYKNLTD